jgi:hypothetical protein
MEFTQAGRADVFCRSSELARRTGEENWLRTLWQYLFEMWQFIVQRWGYCLHGLEASLIQ